MQSAENIDSVAERILSASASRSAIPPITDANPAFDLAKAYGVSAAVRARREKGGERPVGWKIGFTNRAVWQQQGVTAPIWAAMYDGTVAEIDAGGGAVCHIGTLIEPRIEPEIGLRITRVPNPDMEEDELFTCVDAVTHGFEIVQSVYPGWQLKAPDAVAAFAMHGAYRHGPLVQIESGDRNAWLGRLRELRVVILRDGEELDQGVGANVLGGPLSALKHFVRDMTKYPGHAIKPGDLVTTGTMTKAFPIAAGQRWTTRIEGAPLPGLDLRLVD